MKRIIITVLLSGMVASIYAGKKPNLTFDAGSGVTKTLVMPSGKAVEYVAYERLYFVGNVEDSACQYMNVYVPKGATQKTPILLRTYAREDRPQEPTEPTGLDATGRALAEGYVVAIPGGRFASAHVQLLDLKAAVRYLRLFDKKMAGSAERIIADGTGVGGALVSMLGTTGNHPDYEQQLEEMGAADKKDDVYACICYSPLLNKEQEDQAYEWLFNCTNNQTRPLTAEQAMRSNELAAQYARYLNSLELKSPTDGTLMKADNFRSYIKWQLIKAAQTAKNAGAIIPDSIGFTFSDVAEELSTSQTATHAPQQLTTEERLRNAAKYLNSPRQGRKVEAKPVGEYLVNLDLETYLNFLASTQRMKEPAEAGDRAMAYNVETGDRTAQTAPHWYIRHGAMDCQTSFATTTAFAVKLQNQGKEVNFLLAWNRTFGGDYALDELFDWMAFIVHNS